MRPSGEARFGLGVLLGLQLLTSFAGVALLGRMSPAVERIMTENVVSTEAVEEMLSVLVTQGDPKAFDVALEQARTNITEPEETALIDAINANADKALAGDADAREEIVVALHALGSVNRASMRRSDSAAQLLGRAGAWAMALVGFLSFLVSIRVYHRVEKRLLLPFVELDEVLTAVRGGDAHRRVSWQADDLQGDHSGRLTDNLNWLLDQRLGRPTGVIEELCLREALLSLIDRESEHVVLVGNDQGRVVAANEAGLKQAAAWRPLVEQFKAGEAPEGWAVERLPGDSWIARGLSAPS